MTEHRGTPARRGESGAATGSLVLLLLLLVGLGGYNYHRNWSLEQQSEDDRPYQSYSVEDLEALRSAYEQELEATRAQFDRMRQQRARPSDRGGSMTQNLEQFERTTRTSARIRDAAAEVAEREGRIEALSRELQLRSQLGQGLMRHLKRLATF